MRYAFARFFAWLMAPFTPVPTWEQEIASSQQDDDPADWLDQMQHDMDYAGDE
jgi:hypothetical protein